METPRQYFTTLKQQQKKMKTSPPVLAREVLHRCTGYSPVHEALHHTGRNCLGQVVVVLALPCSALQHKLQRFGVDSEATELLQQLDRECSGNRRSPRQDEWQLQTVSGVGELTTVEDQCVCDVVGGEDAVVGLPRKGVVVQSYDPLRRLPRVGYEAFARCL